MLQELKKREMEEMAAVMAELGIDAPIADAAAADDAAKKKPKKKKTKEEIAAAAVAAAIAAEVAAAAAALIPVSVRHPTTCFVANNVGNNVSQPCHARSAWPSLA